MLLDDSANDWWQTAIQCGNNQELRANLVPQFHLGGSTGLPAFSATIHVSVIDKLIRPNFFLHLLI